MIERMEGLPEGIVGLSASGKLAADDYREVLEPALKEAMASGEARVVFVLKEFEGLEPAAVPEDIKTGLSVEFAHRKEWKRLALVTDEDWVAKAMRMFAWHNPGEIRTFPLDGLDEAKEWVAG